MKRILLSILAVSIVANIAWVAFMLHDLRTNQVKAVATVTAINDCGGYVSKGSLRNYCPVFTYTDTQGKSHEYISTEGYNWLNGPLLGVKVGDARTMWYERNDPGAPYVLYGMGMLSVWVLPLIVGVIACVVVFVLLFVGRKKDKWPLGAGGGTS